MLAFSGLRKRGLLRANAPAAVITGTLEWLTSVIVMFVLSIPVAFVTHWASACWLLLPLVRLAVRLIRLGYSRMTSSATGV